MSYLIYDAYEEICWHDADLFEVTNHALPSNWYYKFYGYETRLVSAVWGYKELALSAEHFDNLMEREKEDRALFFKRKEEIDEELKNME